MASDRIDTGDPKAEIPELQGRLKSPRPAQMPGTLASKLTPVADKIRTLYARFGIRPYRVYLVHGRWTGPSGRRGDGVLQVTSRREITPVPRVQDMAAITEELRATGMTEGGGVVIDQISQRFTEDDLMGKTLDLQDAVMQRTTAPGFEFWWEVQENRAGSPNALIRRFTVASVPMISKDGLQWSVGLIRQDYDRARDGTTYPRNAF